MQKIDISGRKFGMLTVIRESASKKIGSAATWECLCDCGKMMFTTSARLNNGRVKSCGCSRKVNLAGVRSGKLIAVKPTDLRMNGLVLWLCKCDCGKEINASSTEIVNTIRKSCGCIKRGRKSGTNSGFHGVRQDGAHWVAFHPVIGDISLQASEHDAACSVRDWLIDNPVFQQAWPLRGYPHP